MYIKKIDFDCIEEKYDICVDGVYSKNYKQTRKRVKLKHNEGRYSTVGLFLKGKLEYFLLHRLLATKFIANPDNKTEVNHKNGNKNDNRLDNLEWATSSENSKHSMDNIYDTRCKPLHTKNNINEMNACKAKEIRHKWLSGQYKQRDLATIYGISQRMIWNIIHNKMWKEEYLIAA